MNRNRIGVAKKLREYGDLTDDLVLGLLYGDITLTSKDEKTGVSTYCFSIPKPDEKKELMKMIEKAIGKNKPHILEFVKEIVKAAEKSESKNNNLRQNRKEEEVDLEEEEEEEEVLKEQEREPEPEQKISAFGGAKKKASKKKATKKLAKKKAAKKKVAKKKSTKKKPAKKKAAKKKVAKKKSTEKKVGGQ